MQMTIQFCEKCHSQLTKEGEHYHVTECITKQIDRLNRLEDLYIELTNCEQYGEGDEVQGHYCPNSLLDKFDRAFKR